MNERNVFVKIITPERVKLQGVVPLPELEAERLIRLGVAELTDSSQLHATGSGNVDYTAALQQAEKSLKDQSATIERLKKELDEKTEIIRNQEIQIADLKKQLVLTEEKAVKASADKKSAKESSEKKSAKEAQKDQ